ncbi:hypothetical protein SUGI_0970600 [Cryptomeria japonica]|uniref:uncharacterized protein LOC131054864 n=1 Tax=Cryptomeria japonica TaxID=3369 RepID=UPI0024148808|nr:uncharacterized protein LOC131054864 [Cryptomeria japonica]GLJ46072.1 hypothetical protein SUGI_0970600 [Cryptomeria japonica]
MAAHRNIEITIISAKDLKNVRPLVGCMRTQAIAWINDEKYYTSINEKDGVNPKWNRRMYFSVEEKLLEHSVLTVAVYSIRGMLGTRDRKLGVAQIPLQDFVFRPLNNVYYGCYELCNLRSKRFRGFLNVGIKVGDLYLQTQIPESSKQLVRYSGSKRSLDKICSPCKRHATPRRSSEESDDHVLSTPLKKCKKFEDYDVYNDDEANDSGRNKVQIYVF